MIVHDALREEIFTLSHWLHSLLLAAGRPAISNTPVILAAVSIGIMVVIAGALLIYLSRRRKKPE